MQNFIGRFIRFIIKLVLAAFGLVLVLGLLLLALIFVVLSLLKSVLTGKKPAPIQVFGKFQKFAPGGIWPGNTRPQAKGDVVDVEMRELKEPKNGKQLP